MPESVRALCDLPVDKFLLRPGSTRTSPANCGAAEYIRDHTVAFEQSLRRGVAQNTGQRAETVELIVKAVELHDKLSFCAGTRANFADLSQTSLTELLLEMKKFKADKIRQSGKMNKMSEGLEGLAYL